MESFLLFLSRLKRPVNLPLRFFEILLGSEQLQMQNIIQEFWIAEDLLKAVLLRPEPVLTVLLMYKTH